MILPADGRAGAPGERAMIEHIRRRLPPAPSSMLVGPGDDAAVLMPTRGALQVLTTDALVEGIHFDRRFSSLGDVGYKALAVNVSDVVAMGAMPEFALLSLILPDGFSLADLDALLDGLLEMAAAAGVALAGGNISRSPGPLVVDMTVTGSVRPRRMLTRSGGRPGDAIYVTGTIGAAAAGLGALRGFFRPSRGFRLKAEATGTVPGGFRLQAEDSETVGGFRLQAEDPLMACVQRHRRPEPRIRAGMLLGRTRAASACMDLSDGLADAVRQIAEASGTGASVDADALPIDPAARAWFTGRGLDPVLSALTGGDDYELLFTVSPRRRGRFRGVERLVRGLPLIRIGELTAAPGIHLIQGGTARPMPEGFTHFPARKP